MCPEDVFFCPRTTTKTKNRLGMDPPWRYEFAGDVTGRTTGVRSCRMQKMESRRGDRRSASVPLPFRTFGEILAHGLEVEVWCTRCKSWGRADLAGRHGQRFAGARFRCKCGGFGCPSISPAAPVPFAPGDMITDLYCSGCVPPWEMRDMRLDRPPWSTVSAFLCPGCRRRVQMHQRAAVASGPTMSQAWLHLSPHAGRPPRG
jgi:hypothetical protein